MSYHTSPPVESSLGVELKTKCYRREKLLALAPSIDCQQLKCTCQHAQTVTHPTQRHARSHKRLQNPIGCNQLLHDIVLMPLRCSSFPCGSWFKWRRSRCSIGWSNSGLIGFRGYSKTKDRCSGSGRRGTLWWILATAQCHCMPWWRCCDLTVMRTSIVWNQIELRSDICR